MYQVSSAGKYLPAISIPTNFSEFKNVAQSSLNTIADLLKRALNWTVSLPSTLYSMATGKPIDPQRVVNLSDAVKENGSKVICVERRDVSVSESSNDNNPVIKSAIVSSEIAADILPNTATAEKKEGFNFTSQLTERAKAAGIPLSISELHRNVSSNASSLKNWVVAQKASFMNQDPS